MDVFSLSKNIKRARQHANLSQEDLALKLGISSKTVSAYETGRAIPPSPMLAKIGSITNTSISEIVGITEPITNEAISKKLDKIENLLLQLLNK